MKRVLIFLFFCLFSPVHFYAQTKDTVTIEFTTNSFVIDTSYFEKENEGFNLVLAAERDDMVAMEILLRKGIDPDVKTFDNITPLMYASQNGNTEAVGLLLDHGADPNAIPDNGITPLISATKMGFYEVSEILLDYGAFIDQTDKNGLSALMYAAAYNYADLVDLFLFYEADYQKKDWFGADALLTAAYYGSYESVKIILDYGADVNTTDDYGFTPLMIASQNGFYDMTWLFLESGADISARNKAGYDALSISVMKEYRDITELLIESGADVNTRVKSGTNPLSLAKKNNDREMISLLKENGARYGYNPDFSIITAGLLTDFNTKDFMTGINMALIDSKYGFEIKGRFLYRPFPVRVLVPETEDLSYQFWERRGIVTGGIGKRFTFFTSDKSAFGASLGLNLAYSWGRYRGADRCPQPESLFAPETKIFWKHNSIGINLVYSYTDLNIHDFSPHRFQLAFVFYFNLNKNKLMHKEIDWY